jgi:hypothetical protein
MSEQLVNLYGSIHSTVAIPTLSPSITLAAPYTSGGTTIQVSASTDPVTGATLPTTGTFSLTILNPETGSVYGIFRVTSVLGTTLTGAAEGPAFSAPSGAAVVGTMLTAAAITQIKTDAGGGGGSGFIQTLTPPVAADFTQTNFNTGSCVTNQFNNSTPVTSITLQQADPTGSLEIAGLTKPIINPLFTLTIGMSAVFNNINGLIGIWLTDGSAVNIIFGFNPGNNGYFATVLNNFSGSFNTNIYGSQCQPLPQGPLSWLRIQETSSLRIFSVSADGINFMELTSVANTDFFTTVDYGFAIEARQAGNEGQLCCYSFQETTP